MIPVVSEPYQAAPGRSGSIRLKDRRQREQNGALQTARSVNHFVNQVTLALMKYLAGVVALLVAVSIELWILSRGMDAPASVFPNGVLTEVVHCDDPPPHMIFRCAALFCQKALYDKNCAR